MIRRRVLLSLALGALVATAPARAYVPDPEPVARAAANVNHAAERTQALRIPVTVRLGGQEPVGRGTLLASPNAQARLEVRHARGFVERQLRRSGGIAATRDGLRLDRPLPLLPPLWVLQAPSGASLLNRLGELGGDPGVLTLGYDGEHDCYLLGGGRGPSFWVDQDTLAVVRIDLAGGVVYRLGPVLGEEDGIQLPAWIEVEAPGSRSIRLELGPAVAVTPAADAFRTDWLDG